MRTIAIAFVLASLGICLPTAAEAQYPVYESPVVVYSTPVYSSYSVPVQTYSTPVYNVYSVPTYTTTAPVYAPAEPGFFGRLMELERRKNAWLRRTFLGMP